MPPLDLKTNSKAVKDYYLGLEEFDKHGVTHEMAVRSAFQRLLEHCSKRVGWTFVVHISCAITGSGKAIQQA